MLGLSLELCAPQHFRICFPFDSHVIVSQMGLCVITLMGLCVFTKMGFACKALNRTQMHCGARQS